MKISGQCGLLRTQEPYSLSVGLPGTFGELERRQDHLRRLLRDRAIAFSWTYVDESLLEAVLARGDRRVADVILRAWQKGCRLDGWSEHF